MKYLIAIYILVFSFNSHASSLLRRIELQNFIYSMALNKVSNRDLISKVNSFVNETVEYQREENKQDYWQDPMETVDKGTGDCEDYAIYKYWLLRDLGFNTNYLRLLHNKVLTAKGLEVHMVLLAYLPESGNSPLVLDNLTDTILPMNQRKDIISYLYAMNEKGMTFQISPTSTSFVARSELKQILKHNAVSDFEKLMRDN